MIRPAHLPNFKAPPVAEVALSIQFGTLSAFQSIYAGLLWDEYRPVFDEVEEHSPLPSTFETFGLPTGTARGPISFTDRPPPLPRYWFKSRDGTQLIQFQQDKFVHNWRRQEPGPPYPRYEAIRESYASEIETLQAFLKAHSLGEVSPNQCEITYINHIPFETPGGKSLSVADILAPWSGKYSDSNLGEADGFYFQLQYSLKGSNGMPVGRLYAQCQNAVRNADQKQILTLTLTARGKPDESTIESAMQFLDRGRDCIVQGFASLTTTTAHKLWERNDA